MTILPEEQKYGDFSINPMYAESEGRVLAFKNICAVLAIKLEKSDLAKIKSIRVSSSNHGMCGEFAVEPTETGFKAVLADEQALTPVVLSCGEAVELSEDTTIFHIAIPEQRYKSLNIEISADGLNYGKSMTFTKTANVKANHIYPIDFVCDFVPEGAVDLGLSVYWADHNVGGTNPQDYGTYFAWGDITGQTWNGSSWSGGGFSSLPEYELDDNGNLKPDYDAAHVNLGGSWRMPTKAEQQELIDNCTSTWTSNYNGTGVAGRIFTSNKTGYTDKSIFLPAAGYGYASSLNSAGSYGHYWSSTFNYDRDAWKLFFYSGNVSTGITSRNYGQSIRPVTE